MSFLENFRVGELLHPDVLFTVLRVAGTLLGGWILLKLLSLLTARLIRKRLTPQTRMLVQKGIVYAGGVIILINVLASLGINLTALLGAAGIAGIAIGFASQTSISNLISGLFLISEKPFSVGDTIRVGETTGIVLSIDLMSVKIRTFDNLFIRMPNQELLNTKLTNITRFPIRRMDIKIGVAYKENIRRVREVLADIARRNPYSLDEPEPLILMTGFGESSLDFLIGLWFVKTDFLVLRNSILEEIKERFDAEGIEIPFPHRTLYSGSATPAFPVRIVEEAPPARGAKRGGNGRGRAAAVGGQSRDGRGMQGPRGGRPG